MSPTTGDTRVDADTLRLLAEPLRAQIVELLTVEQLCTCHLVELTGARQTNVSNHLRALREAGLVTSEPFGRFTYYRLEPDAIEGLAAGLSAVATAARTARDRRRPCP
ncbi:metalloregulator ArsR/SmtB family transcription factor [soil metagenome]